MKKTLPVSLSVLALTLCASSVLAQPPAPPPNGDGFAPPPQKHAKNFKAQEQKFNERLKLTDEQVALAKKNRIEGHKKIKPIMQEIMQKKDKLFEIRESNLSDAEKKKQTAALKTQIRALEDKADDIREENMKNFESILTAEQKQELAKIKAEGAAKRKQMMKYQKRF
ncbi:MAG: Spy/CpxP family protein refolding chaperone [Candidatus Gastranaerophilales bacterium]|nr:Spy/CpxP family protein refolding chaperone [Candidatus Gastranaerophilales bacterium]